MRIVHSDPPTKKRLLSFSLFLTYRSTEKIKKERKKERKNASYEHANIYDYVVVYILRFFLAQHETTRTQEIADKAALYVLLVDRAPARKKTVGGG